MLFEKLTDIGEVAGDDPVTTPEALTGIEAGCCLESSTVVAPVQSSPVTFASVLACRDDTSEKRSRIWSLISIRDAPISACGVDSIIAFERALDSDIGTPFRDCGRELSGVVADDGDGGESSQVEEEDLSEVVRLGSVCCERLVDVLAISAPPNTLAALDDKPRRSKAGTSLSE